MKKFIVLLTLAAVAVTACSRSRPSRQTVSRYELDSLTYDPKSTPVIWPSRAASGTTTGVALKEPTKILDGDQPINVDIGHAAPAVADIDSDGKKDLIVGQFGGGKVRVYLNQGANADPKFKGFTYLKSTDDKEMSVPAG